MKNEVVSVAYPTIPIVFLGGIRPDRRPIYNTMGLAVTDLEENVRTETAITLADKKNGIKFSLGGKPAEGKRNEDTINSVKSFLKDKKLDVGLEIDSANYNIKGGSSDSGLAALFSGLNELLGTKMKTAEIAGYAMRGSESAIRSVYGGLSKIVVDEPEMHGVAIASSKDLDAIRIFTVYFDYPGRITADEIHAAIVTHPWYKHRVDRIPFWIKGIEDAIKKKDFVTVLKNAEENIRNAHYLLEDVGLRVRRKKIMDCWIDVEEMRAAGLHAYCLQGGGNLVSIACLKEQADKVYSELVGRGWSPLKYKVAGGPKVIRSD
ncbi:MAG: hypothetical protein HY516_02460 [Candidatus Aenigmarchaeota archaeon]|nr:hypothetical protein [Candidatus Aenigmarchaeota archaeon]